MNTVELTIDNQPKKDVFRHSITSQTSTITTTDTSNSSQRLSVVSFSEDDTASRVDDHVTNVSTISNPSIVHSLRPRIFRNQILNRLRPNRHDRQVKSLSEPCVDDMIDGPPALFTTENVIHLDPWCTSVKYALENCILSDSMHKYEPSLSFTFTKTWKRRYVVLVDRVVFIFKTSKSTSPPKEHFTLTDDTFVFVTEEFKKGYVIELRKPSVRWYIRCDSITQMKSWLESMKKVVACIKIGFDGVLSSTMLSSISLSEDYRIIIHQPITMNPHRKSLPPINTLNTRYPIPHVSTVSSSSSVKRQSLAEIPDWEASIPPQLPPPTSKLPAVPPLFAVSE